MTTKRLTPIQSIKAYCKKECCANDLISWKECNNSKCPLYELRMGKRPQRLAFSKCNKKQRVLKEDIFSTFSCPESGLEIILNPFKVYDKKIRGLN